MPAQKRRKQWGNNPKFKVPRSADGPFSTSYNKFHLLSDEEEEDISPKEKVPPIIVDNTHSFTTVFGLIGENYMFKRMSIGTKILSTSVKLYEDAIKVLKERHFSFYTHQIRNAKRFKMVLFGLPRFDTKVLTDEFVKTHNIHPVSVKEINTKRSNEDDTLYLVEFDRDHVSKREVLKIRYFCNIAVYWRRPLKGNKGPTQCTKCSMYGHGASHCNRVDVCAACAGNHNSEICPLSKSSKDVSVVYKCHNCTKKNMKNVNHRADDPKCPCRQEYLKIRQRVTFNSRAVTTTGKVANFNAVDASFPPLSGQKHQATKQPDSRHQRRSLYSEVAKSKNVVEDDDDDDDISNEKLLEIFFDAVDALQKCQNKYDKLRVLGMMLKHAI